ncbi:MAG: aldehyde dehydrogenase family protein [Acidimicrobiales bacterium]|nr:aldehyde dehydrogenase family protein [Acidimicrobiales bacterium]
MHTSSYAAVLGSSSAATSPDLGPELAGGAYLRPVVLADVRSGDQANCEEVFGLVLVVVLYADQDDAVRLANDTEYGLVGGVTGIDVTGATALARQLVAGTVWVNSWHHMHPEAPFGGFKMSGIGGRWGAGAWTSTPNSRTSTCTSIRRPNPLLTEWYSRG